MPSPPSTAPFCRCGNRGPAGEWVYQRHTHGHVGHKHLYLFPKALIKALSSTADDKILHHPQNQVTGMSQKPSPPWAHCSGLDTSHFFLDAGHKLLRVPWIPSLAHSDVSTPLSAFSTMRKGLFVSLYTDPPPTAPLLYCTANVLIV